MEDHDIPRLVGNHALEGYSDAIQAVAIALIRGFNGVLGAVVEPILVGAMHHLMDLAVLVCIFVP